MKQQKIPFWMDRIEQKEKSVGLSYKKRRYEDKEKIFHFIMTNCPNSVKKHRKRQDCQDKAGFNNQRDILDRKSPNHKIFHLQQLQTTHRSIPDPSENHRIILFLQKLNSIYSHRVAKLFFNKIKRRNLTQYAKQPLKKRFQRSRRCQTHPSFHKQMAVLSFANLTNRILDYKTLFMVKLELFYRQKPIKPYLTSIVFLLVRLQERQKILSLRESVEILKNYH